MAVRKELRAASEAICTISGEAAELAKALTDMLDVDRAIGGSVAATCVTLGTAMTPGVPALSERTNWQPIMWSGCRWQPVTPSGIWSKRNIRFGTIVREPLN